MSFADLYLKPEYTTGKDNFQRDFFVPTLKEAKTYDRAVGYFSSSALVALSRGLYAFVEHGGKIRVLTSPQLSPEDFDSILKGYAKREEIIEQTLMASLEPLEKLDEASIDRLAFLADLIARDVMDIRIAFRKKGLYHEKIGILSDSEGRRVAFTGSANETGSALFDNYETISVFRDWVGEEERVKLKADHFEQLWNNQDSEITVVRSELLKAEIIRKYQQPTTGLNRDELDLNEEFLKTETIDEGRILGIPENVELREYQCEAIRNFLHADGRGIFDMATGTGKTYTALGAICALREQLESVQKKSLGIFIVVPMTYLVEQWAADLRYFGIEPIIAYSDDKYADWSRKLSTALTWHSVLPDKKFFCIVTTNDTFAGEKMRQALANQNQKTSNFLLVVDEAHNFGAAGKRKLLTDLFKYRLALSATLVRHNDKEGTDALLAYFGQRCIEYSLEKAIAEGFLTPYEYYPVFITLTEAERLAYADISAKILKNMVDNGNGQMVPNKTAEMLLFKRARLVATAQEKLSKLAEMMPDFQDKQGILVYCGTSGRISEVDEYRPMEEISKEEKSQIDAVARLLNSLEIKAAKYTSEETTSERIDIIEQFKNDNIQALVAIKCLDEGVSIQSIKYAFILASTTNPKEYIQRRGRVLRRFRGKDKALIYDFIALPAALGEKQPFMKNFKRLAEKEMKRFYEFNRLAVNRIENNGAYLQVISDYSLNPKDIEAGAAE